MTKKQWIAFAAIGRPQQRGSKTPFLLRRKNGDIVTRKSGAAAIAVADSNQKSKAWMDTVRCAASSALPADWQLIRGPVVLSVTFRFARPKSHYGTGANADKLKPSAPKEHTQAPDLSKLVRALEDALTGVVWSDDRQVFKYLELSKEWTTGSEGADVVIAER